MSAKVCQALCAGCRYLLTYRCPCQAPKCRKGVTPGAVGCIKRPADPANAAQLEPDQRIA